MENFDYRKKKGQNAPIQVTIMEAWLVSFLEHNISWKAEAFDPLILERRRRKKAILYSRETWRVKKIRSLRNGWWNLGVRSQ
jgi:hypothetical protein